MDVNAALKAICMTGRGCCWYCEVKLPKAEQAIRAGWDVQRVDEKPAASIILVCPMCLQEKAELGEERFFHGLALRVSNVTC